MSEFRVFIEAVDNADDPLVLARLAKFCNRDEATVRRMLGNLPARLVDRVDMGAAGKLKLLLEPLGMRIILKEIGTSANGRGAPPASLNLFQRLGWGFEVLGHSWWRQWLLLLLVVAVMAAADALSFLFAPGPMSLSPGSTPDLAQLLLRLATPAGLGAMLLAQVVIMLVGFLYQAVLIRLVPAFMEAGGSVTMTRLLSDAWRRVPDLVSGLGILMLPPTLLLMLVGAAGVYLLLPARADLMLLLMALAVVLTVTLVVCFALLGPVLVLESVTPWQALGRAWRLGRGRRWRIFGNLLALALGLVLVGLGLELLSAAALAAAAGLGLAGVIGVSVAALGTLSAFGVLVVFMVSFVPTAFYVEARVQSEGWMPPWEMVPHPTWEVSETPAAPATGRGARAWLELAVYVLLAGVILVGGAWLAAHRLAAVPLPPMGMAPPGFQQSRPPAHARSQPPEQPPPSRQSPSVGAKPATPSLHLKSDAVFATPSGVALWLKVALDPLPQLPAGVNGTGLVTLRIEHVGGPGGSELYAPDSPMEQGAAGGVYLNRSATGGWSGVRTVYLRAGSQKQAVGTVRGEVVLSLPTGVRWAELTAGDIGQEREAADGIGVTLLHLGGTGVALQLHGTDLSMHLAGIAGIMTDGALSAPESMTPTYSGDQVHIEADFTDPPRGVRVLLAHGRRQSRHPFSLAPGQTLNFPLR